MQIQYVTRREKPDLCTQNTPFHITVATYLLYSLRVQNFASCMRFPMKSSINSVNFIRLL